MVLDSHVAFLTLTNVQAADAGRYTVVITNEVFASPGYLSLPADLVVDVDLDQDGLPDTWESAHGLNPTVADAHEDSDGDGFTNAQEYETGTDPADTDSYLRMEDIATGGSVVIRFVARAGRPYSVVVADDVGGPYVKLVDVAADAADRMAEVRDAVVPGKRRYYRLVVGFVGAGPQQN
jgi:hypothetical protein